MSTNSPFDSYFQRMQFTEMFESRPIVSLHQRKNGISVKVRAEVEAGRKTRNSRGKRLADSRYRYLFCFSKSFSIHEFLQHGSREQEKRWKRAADRQTKRAEETENCPEKIDGRTPAKEDEIKHVSQLCGAGIGIRLC